MSIIKLKTILIAIMAFFHLTVRGQDPHFSMYFASPLTLNPAMTGYFDGDYRASANFRQQWWSLGSPFVTTTMSFDSKLMQLKIPEKDIFGGGIMALIDQSFGGAYNSINISASGSYHKALDEFGEHNIGAGFQFSYASRNINAGGLSFANQFTGSGFDTRLPSNENFIRTKSNYVDLNTGLLYRYSTENTEVYLGGSLYHTIRPNNSFLKDGNYRLPMRYTVHAGSKFSIGSNGNELFLSGLYMYQAGATEKNVGIAYGISVNENTSVYAGSWYRIGEAILPYIGLDNNNFQMGLTYDIINSKLRNYSPKNGSFELSVNVLMYRPRNVYTNYKRGRIF
ncbi:MAG: PorP/SprF family type IX secretion system membrane protein [Ferruginibacter sp.]|nr:PorP/SprF family type IX secretion system membrane protein [Ferruginibacter sp.]